MVCNVCMGRRKNEEEDGSLNVVSVLLLTAGLMWISSIGVVDVVVGGCWVMVLSALSIVVSSDSDSASASVT